MMESQSSKLIGKKWQLSFDDQNNGEFSNGSNSFLVLSLCILIQVMKSEFLYVKETSGAEKD